MTEQRGDGPVAGEQRDADVGEVADRGLQPPVDARVVLGALDEEGVARGDRVLDDRLRDRAAAAEQRARAAGRGADEQVAAVDEADHPGVRAR